jgi:SAM-dependent methyltransferase
MKTPEEIAKYNKKAWDREVELENPWTVPVSSQEIAQARQGKFKILLTPSKPVPADWFPPLKDCRLLCLASGGGQQGPLMAAAGAHVTVFDNSPRQLARDREVAQRENLDLRLVEGDMANLSDFEDASFDFIIHPVSNVFVPDVHPVWKEAFRVLAPGGTLIAGFINPVEYIFDCELAEQGIFDVKYSLPYSDLTSISAEERELKYKDEPVEFGHLLEDQIGGQLDAGFHLIGFYEDSHGEDAFSKIMPTFIATRALKPHL